MIPHLFDTCNAGDWFCNIGIGFGLFGAFLAFWFVMMFVVAVMSGWRVLVEKYGLPEGQSMPEGMQYKWRSAALWGRFPTNYNSCLVFTTTLEGLGIAPVWIFSAGHPAMFIPWGDITLEEKKFFLAKRLKLKIAESRYSFYVWGKNAAFIRAAKPS